LDWIPALDNKSNKLEVANKRLQEAVFRKILSIYIFKKRALFSGNTSGGVGEGKPHTCEHTEHT
jgi:hypothetical protein